MQISLFICMVLSWILLFVTVTHTIHSAICTRFSHSFIITGILITCTCLPSSASTYQACTPSSSLSGLVISYSDYSCSHQKFSAFPYLIFILISVFYSSRSLRILITSRCLRSSIYIIPNLTSFIFICVTVI